MIKAFVLQMEELEDEKQIRAQHDTKKVSILCMLCVYVYL